MRNVLLSLVVAIVSPSVLWAEEPAEEIEIGATLEAIFEAVLDHHIQPPTRQEMVLALARKLNNHTTPAHQAELSRTISELSGKEALYDFVRQQIAGRAQHLNFDPDHLDRLDLEWLSAVVPGGVRLESPKRADVQRQLAANRYVGIGVQIIKGPDGFVFPMVMEKGPAARGGVRSGDRLTKINGQPVAGEIDDVIDRLRGPEGSQVQLTVQTHDQEPRETELRRQVVMIDSVQLKRLEQGESTAVITIENVKASTVHELQTIIEGLPKSVKAISLAIQFDGNFHYFHLLADALLDECTLGKVVTRDGQRMIKTFDGNILAGRTLTIALPDRAEPQAMLGLLLLLTGESDEYLNPNVFSPVFLRESFPILKGQAYLLVAARRFQRGATE